MYFSFLAVIITALAACFIRFFQFLKYTGAKSGLVVGDDLLTFVLYGVVALSLFFCFLYFFFSKRYERIIAFIGNKSIYITLLILSFTYFFDFSLGLLVSPHVVSWPLRYHKIPKPKKCNMIPSVYKKFRTNVRNFLYALIYNIIYTTSLRLSQSISLSGSRFLFFILSNHSL